jgi:hypothetical protein
LTDHASRLAPFLLQSLVWAVLLEALLLRLVLRLGPLMPHTALVEQLASVGLFAGMVSLNLAYLFTALALLTVGWQALVREHIALRVFGAIVLVAWVIGLSIDVFAVGVPFVFAAYHIAVLATMACALFLPRAQSEKWNWQARVALGLMLAAYAAATYHVLGNTLMWQGIALSGAAFAPSIAEGLAVAVAVPLSFMTARRRSLAAVVIASSVAGLYLGLSMFKPWLPPLLAMWNFSFSLFLPTWVYALAIWLYTHTVVCLWGGQENERRAAFALVLIALGGLRPDYFYMQRLVWLGILTAAMHLPTQARVPKALR